MGFLRIEYTCPPKKTLNWVTKLHETHQGLDHWNSHLIYLQLEVNFHPIHKFQSCPAWIFVVFMELVQILDQLPGLEGFGLAEKKRWNMSLGKVKVKVVDFV